MIFPFIASLEVQYAGKQFHQSMIENDQNGDSCQYNMNRAPRFNNDPCLPLSLQGLHQVSMGEQCVMCALEIRSLIYGQRGHEGIPAGKRTIFKPLHTIYLKRLRLTSAEPLNGKFQFQDTFLNRLHDTYTIGARISRDDMRLPVIEQAPNDATDDEKDQAPKVRLSPHSFA